MKRVSLTILLLVASVAAVVSPVGASRVVSITNLQHYPPARPPDFISPGWTPWELGGWCASDWVLSYGDGVATAYIDGPTSIAGGPGTYAQIIPLFPLTPDEYGGMGPIKFDWRLFGVNNARLQVWRVDPDNSNPEEPYATVETLVWQSPGLFPNQTGHFETLTSAGYYWRIDWVVVPEPSGALVLLGGLGLATGWRRSRRTATAHTP